MSGTLHIFRLKPDPLQYQVNYNLGANTWVQVFSPEGLEEFLRVLKPRGVVAILEFSQPTNRAFGVLYHFFSNRVLPKIGGMISGSKDAYSYLPESIKRFRGAEALAWQMKAAGFKRVEFERMTGGAVALHLGYK